MRKSPYKDKTGNLLTATPSNHSQIAMGKVRAYKFDDVFDENADQIKIFNTCAKDLVDGCFEGYNATILAYGQTSSGKTYTMGSYHKYDTKKEDLGIIPRVIGRIFEKIQEQKLKSEFILKVNFIEIYNGEIIDLLGDNIILSSRRI